MKELTQEIQNGLEEIMSKYYFELNTKDTRDLIAKEAKAYIISKIGEDKASSYKGINIETDKGNINISFLKD